MKFNIQEIVRNIRGHGLGYALFKQSSLQFITITLPGMSYAELELIKEKDTTSKDLKQIIRNKIKNMKQKLKFPTSYKS